MKLKEALKTIDEQWIRKPKGFRVHFQKKVESEIITDYVPGTDEKPLDSDVLTWRLAWKLAQVSNKENGGAGTKFYNIYVVDDLGNPINFFKTGRPEIYNPGIE
jgi:hypothetical protein